MYAKISVVVKLNGWRDVGVRRAEHPCVELLSKLVNTEGQGRLRSAFRVDSFGRNAVRDELAIVASALVLRAVVASGEGCATTIMGAFERSQSSVNAAVSSGMSACRKVFVASCHGAHVTNLLVFVGVRIALRLGAFGHNQFADNALATTAAASKT